MKDKEVKKYKFDREAFKLMVIEESYNHVSYWKNKSMKERLEAGFYLTCLMYGVDKHTPLDKTVFSKRKHGGPEITSTSAEQ